jgi:glucosamine--fructose-6-phosphate aminotransferase (isomerizing)
MTAAIQGPKGVEQAFLDLERAAECLFSADENQIVEAAEILHSGTALAFVGRGPAYAAARQCALTFMEGAKRLLISFSGGAFRHGPFECLDQDFRAIFLMPKGRTFSINENMAREAAELGAKVVCLTDTEMQREENIHVIRLKNVENTSSETLFPLVISGAQALLLHHFARLKGIEAGQFRYCSKVTTKE